MNAAGSQFSVADNEYPHISDIPAIDTTPRLCMENRKCSLTCPNGLQKKDEDCFLCSCKKGQSEITFLLEIETLQNKYEGSFSTKLALFDVGKSEKYTL